MAAVARRSRFTLVVAEQARRWRRFRPSAAHVLDAVGAVTAATALVVYMALPQPALDAAAVDAMTNAALETVEEQREASIARRTALAEQVRYRGGESLVAFYGGSPYTYASDVRIVRPGTDLTAHGIDWEGRPFEHPIYYGVRVARWLPGSSLGGMLDFTHSKVYSPMGQKTKFSGNRDGKPMPAESPLGEQFHKLEFTHGHNMLTLNALWRLPLQNAFLSPYVGIGAGASLPHTEVQLKGENDRTYEYQYTGPAGQVVLGIELRVPRFSYFIEYKFTSAAYSGPLHNRDGSWVVQDLWHQVKRWMSGKEPAGGWVKTNLTSHQVIFGGGIRSGAAGVAAP